MNQTDRLEALKQKYETLFGTLDRLGVHLNRVQLNEDNMVVYGAADSEHASSAITRELDQIDPNWADELVLNIRTEAGQKPPRADSQTVVNTPQDLANQSGADQAANSRR